jgi:membrane protease YdiL (CAAX protease family)
MEILLSKRFFITGLLAVFSVFFLGYFIQADKVNPVFQMLLVMVAFFLVVPALYCKIVLKEPLHNMGWQSGNVFSGVFLSLLALSLGLVIMYGLDRYTSFGSAYRLPQSIQTDFLWFLLYEALMAPLVVLFYEVFFRGFIGLLWLRSLGVVSIFLQAGLFVLLLFVAGDLSANQVPALIFAPLAGLIAYYSQSVWYSWGATWLFFFLIDVYLLISR